MGGARGLTATANKRTLKEHQRTNISMTNLTKKLWKTIKRTLLVVVVLVSAAVAVLAVTGVPNVG